MNVWYRSAALAGGLLLLMGMQVGAHKEGAGSDRTPGARRGLVARPNHPVVLLNGQVGEGIEGEQIVEQVMLQQLDPRTAVEKISPPKGVGGIIAYPAARRLMLRGTKEAVASYRASLEMLDREAGPAAASAAPPVVTLEPSAKLSLKAERIESDGGLTRATGNVVIGLPGGIEIRAHQVRVTTEGGKKRIVIEK